LFGCLTNAHLLRAARSVAHIATLTRNICVCERTVDTWVKQGLLPPPRLIGGKRLWKWKTVESYLEGTHNEAQTPERQAEDITNATRAASGRAGDASAGVGRHTAAGLVQTRSDVGCAAITSGVVALAAMQRDLGHPIPWKPKHWPKQKASQSLSRTGRLMQG
jgi:hypothetical protein